MPSQYGQDQWVIQFLSAKRDGFFLDTGAANGIDSSNTEVLEKQYGWTGLCVEPNTDLFRQLVQNRQCRCVNACLFDRETDLAFLEAAGTLGGIIEKFQPEQLDYAVRMKDLPLDATGCPRLVMKRTTTLASVLRLANAPTVIDYWSLDTEGTELLLLQSFPFDRFVFNMLTVEHNYQPVRSSIRRFLEGRGYEYWTSCLIDDCYVRKTAFPGRYRTSATWHRIKGAR